MLGIAHCHPDVGEIALHTDWRPRPHDCDDAAETVPYLGTNELVKRGEFAVRSPNFFLDVMKSTIQTFDPRIVSRYRVAPPSLVRASPELFNHSLRLVDERCPADLQCDARTGRIASGPASFALANACVVNDWFFANKTVFEN